MVTFWISQLRGQLFDTQSKCDLKMLFIPRNWNQRRNHLRRLQTVSLFSFLIYREHWKKHSVIIFSFSPSKVPRERVFPNFETRFETFDGARAERKLVFNISKHKARFTEQVKLPFPRLKIKNLCFSFHPFKDRNVFL